MVPSNPDQLPKPTATDLIKAAAELESRARSLIRMCGDVYWDWKKDELTAQAMELRRVAGMLVVMASTPQQVAA